MELSDWASRWQEGRTAFHQRKVSPLLEAYAEHVWGPDGPTRVYVPMCGKSLDLVFLAGLADEVLGVEYVEQAVTEFFTEQGLTPEIVTDPTIVHRSGPISLFVADVFDITTADVGAIDAVFDRAALVALDPAARAQYADHLTALLEPGATILLVTLDYEQAEMSGPPFAVDDAEVHRLFGEGFAIEHLEERDALDDVFRERGLSEITESAYQLTRRG